MEEEREGATVRRCSFTDRFGSSVSFCILKQRLVVQLREIVRYCSLQLVVITVASDWICLAWLEISAAVFASAGFVGGQLIELVPVVASAIYRKTWSSNSIPDSILRIFSSLSFLILRTLEHCSAVSFSGDFPSFPVVVLLVRGFYQSLRDFSQGCEGERQYRTLILPAGIVATMREWLTTTVHGRGNSRLSCLMHPRLVVQLREIVRYCRLQLVVITVASDWICLAWLEISAAVFASAGFVGGQLIELVPVVASAIYRKTWSSNSIPDSILRIFSSLSFLILRTLEHYSAVSFSGDFPSFPVVVLLVRGFYQSLRDFSQGCEGERQYRTLILPAGIVATMRRVVNYHSSWARQQQVELFDASGNPGSTAGRGFNPAGGTSGGG
ncbi:hypothetical protein F511_34617 [Dorcoceras hygrometricum]|uniref:Uncharacterized protein n=1 Tax=Dorcoceras hygrometricum TaxID=472368 RepID=A0A2Z7C4L7_9LAMI|nr:hypothetical protein F511_34617 [Dorcoceras hygrometricum]